MMETLDRLFAEARNESPVTTLNDVQKWLGPFTFGALMAALLTKLKLFVTLKPLIMISSVITAVGIGAGAIFIMNASEEPKQTPSVPVQAAKAKKRETPETKTSVIAPQIFYKTATLSDTLPPLTRMLNEWNAVDVSGTPTIPYCLSVPLEGMMVLPAVPPTPFVGPVDDYGTFKALKLSGAVNVVLAQGNAAEVRIEGDEKQKEHIIIKNDNQTLEVTSDFKASNWKSGDNAKVTVYITVVDLDKIDCSGAATVTTSGELKFDDLKMLISGASDLEMSMNITNFSVVSSGASEIVLVGSADNMEIVNSGATEFNAMAFKVKKANINCSGASELTVNVTEEMDVKLSGASDMKYSGSPTIINKSVSGASDIKEIK